MKDYDFVKLGEGLTESLLKAAQEQVTKAQAILDQTQSLTDIIMTQVRAQAQQIEDMNVRFKAFGEQMLDAHRVLNGSDPLARGSDGVTQAPVPHLDRLRALAGGAAGHVAKDAGVGPVDPTVAPAKLGYGADYLARQGRLPQPLADFEQFRVNRTGTSADHNDPATGSDRS